MSVALLKNSYAILLSGGIGSRFWPLSTEEYPKQFHDIMGTGQTLLQSTFYRITKIIPKENVLVVSNHKYINIIAKQLPEITNQQIIGEPEMKNTAPCILMASHKIKKINNNAKMIVLPCDHWIHDDNQFILDIQKGIFFCNTHPKRLFTIGVKPHFPSTGYGYMFFDKNSQKDNIYKVIKFTEKPNIEKAKSFLQSDQYLWNSGIFIWHIDAILNAFKKYQPSMWETFYSDTYNTAEESNFIAKAFSMVKNISIDYSVMEKSENTWVLPANFYWNDIGTWQALHDEKSKNTKDNVLIGVGNSLLQNANSNIVFTNKNKKIVIRGLSNYIIVDHDDVLMIYPKEKHQEIKNIKNKV